MTQFAGSCPSEAFQGDFRLLSARSPNIKVKKNQNVALEPYHYIHDLLQESDTCKRQSNWFSQSGCPEINRHGFIFKDECFNQEKYVKLGEKNQKLNKIRYCMLSSKPSDVITQPFRNYKNFSTFF